jgi:hypothetical protein
VGKYDPLRDALRSGPDRCELTFQEIAELVGGLAQSAYNHQAWWSNEVDGRHVQAHAWIDAGMLVARVNLLKRRVRFIRRRS